MKTRTFQTPSGNPIAFTALGLGGAAIGNLYRARSDREADQILQTAWDGGIRYFDTAPLYGLGLSETRLNRFLRGKPRDSFVLSTKVGRLLQQCPAADRTGIGFFFDTPSRREIYDYGHDGILRSFEASLERLGLDRIDILNVHDIDLFNHKTTAARDARIAELMQGGYRALRRLRDEGTIKAFGAGVNDWQTCEILARQGDFDLFLMAGQYSLLRQDALDSFLPLCAARGIGVIVGGVFNSGILATGAKPGAKFDYAPASDEILDRVRCIEAICATYDVSLADAALRFPPGHPSVVSVLTGAGSAQEVSWALAGLETRIPDEFWQALASGGLIRPDALAQIDSPGSGA